MKTPQARGHELNERAAELFNDSLEQCTSTRRFLDRFYELFIGSSPEVAAKFANTDLRAQKAAVKISFYMIMASVQQKPEGGLVKKCVKRLRRRPCSRPWLCCGCVSRTPSTM
jgi:hypothetical protein